MVSLLNRNNKKIKTMFSRVTRWLDRLIPFGFQVEHKTGAKIGLPDYLLRYPSSDAKLVSTYDSMFTVAKISLIRSAIVFTKKPFSKGKLESPKATNNNRVCIISNRNQSFEGERICDGNWTNHRATNCISDRSTKFNGNLIETIVETDFGHSYSHKIFNNSKPNLNMERKIRTLLERHPSISSSDKIEEIDQNIQAVTTEVYTQYFCFNSIGLPR